MMKLILALTTKAFSSLIYLTRLLPHSIVSVTRMLQLVIIELKKYRPLLNDFIAIYSTFSVCSFVVEILRNRFLTPTSADKKPILFILLLKFFVRNIS